MNLFQPSLNRILDDAGRIAPFARMYFYYTQTLSAAPAYSDAAGVTPIVNPVVADSSGILPASYLDPAVTYRVILRTAEDADLIWDVDPVKGFDESQLADAAAATLVARNEAVAAASSATADAGIASSAAQTAVTASATASADLPYANAYATTLPKGVTSTSITAAGTGGTDGTYTLGVSGGPAGFTGTYTITSGGVSSITITNPGLSTATTAPTLSFPSGSVTGATATATVSSLVANQKVYWALSADSSTALLYGNNGGSVAAAPFGGTQAVLPLNPSVATLSASLMSTQVIGRPTTPVDDTTQVSTARVIGIQGFQGLASGTLDSFQFYAGASGTVTIYRYNSANVVQATSSAIAVTSGTTVTLAASDYGASVAAFNPGDKIAFAGSVAGIFKYNPSGGADGLGFGTISGTTITPLTGSRVQVKANIRYQSVQASTFDSLSNTLASTTTTANANAIAIALLNGPQTIGRPTAITAAALTAGNFTYVWNAQVEQAGTLTGINIDALATGSITVAMYTRSGTTMTRTRTVTVAVPTTGPQTITTSMLVAQGEYPAIYGNGILKYDSGTTADNGGWGQIGSGAPASATIASWTTTSRLAAGFNFSVQKVTAASLSGPLTGKKVGFWGDSISTQTGVPYAASWMPVFVTQTGCTVSKVDARPGRTYSAALEGYGASSPLASVGSLTTYSGANSTAVGMRPVASPSSTLSYYNTLYGAPDGTSLSAWLSDLDYLVVWLGTNDARVTGTPSYAAGIGTLTDGYTAGTFHAAMNFFFDAIQTAKPGQKIIVVTPYQTQSWYDYATGRSYSDAIIAQCAVRAFPVLDLYKTSGVNSLNYSTWLTDDGGGIRIHPQTAMSQTIIGPALANFAKGA